ncbi:MAG: iron-containing alcohol dehydrogenase [Prevotellaceae bacterium]|nr:iron-containing alcohol dehydrogenase [Prevotellaceae bacterium]
MRPITLQQLPRTLFGVGCLSRLGDDCTEHGVKRLFILHPRALLPSLVGLMVTLQEQGLTVHRYDRMEREPTVSDFYDVLGAARKFRPDAVIGIGGGSVMDMAKLIAAFAESNQRVEECFGTGLVKKRALWLACAPTTAGTGSEVSPNAILLDETDKMKKSIISPLIMSDVVYIDPTLTFTVPPRVTAETGMDALTRCMEAYTNKYSHPVIDMYALEGIRLIAHNLLRAVRSKSDLPAREALLCASYYGGICLGPVNTAAVHALSYPLGGEYHISHGLANAILLPAVMRFNMKAAPERYIDIARVCGVSPSPTPEDAVAFVVSLAHACGIPARLFDVGVPRADVPHLAESAMKVTRLLKNNPREVTLADAVRIYESLF